MNQRFFRKLLETCSVLMVKLRLSSECVSKIYSSVLTDITLSTYLISLGLLLLFVTAVFALCFKDGILEIMCIY
jgi:hypothetical protein